MNINERNLSDITVLDLEGNMAREENAQFRKYVASIINSGARKLILNLSRVSYMDSNGLGELISCYTAIQAVSGHVMLLGPNHRLQNLLAITKLDTLFETFDTETAAIASFTDGAGSPPFSIA